MNDKEKIIWASAILEGEGSFSEKSKNSIVIQCTMTDNDIVVKLQEILGGNVCFYKKRKSNWKDSWVWTLNGQLAEDCCYKILPYMGVRRSSKIQYLLDKRASWHKEIDDFDKRVNSAIYEYNNSNQSLRQLEQKYKVSRQTISRKNGIVAQR